MIHLEGQDQRITMTITDIPEGGGAKGETTFRRPPFPFPSRITPHGMNLLHVSCIPISQQPTSVGIIDGV